jgi:hypothetical protein
MPKRYLTKFDDGGQQCKNDINYLRTHPECGIPFIQDRPFNPVNPMPLHKFSQIERDFDIDKYRQVPRVPTHVAPTTPDINKKIKGSIKTDPYTVYMTQDTTNDFFLRRLGGQENMIDRYAGYEPIGFEPIGNQAYAHQDLIPSFGETEAIGANRQAYDVGGDVPLEDFGAGRGINNGTQFVDRSNFDNLPSGDPRMEGEFAEQPPQEIGDAEIQEFAERLNTLIPPPQEIADAELDEFIRNIDNVLQDSGAGTSREPIELQDFGAGTSREPIQDTGAGLALDPARESKYVPRPKGAGTSGAGTSGAGTSGAGTSGAGSSGAGTSGAGTSGAGSSGAGSSGAGTSGAGTIESQEIPRPRGSNPRNLRKQAIQNLTRNATRSESETIRREIVPDFPDVPDNARVFLNDLDGSLVREVIEQGFGDPQTGEVKMDAMQAKIIDLQNDLKILNGDPKAIVEKQIQDLHELMRKVVPFSRQGAPPDAPPDAPPSPPEDFGELSRRRVPRPEIEGTEIFVINPELEERIIVEEAQRFIRRGRNTITMREAEQIIKKYSKKGITRERIFGILKEFNLYDQEFEQLLRQIPDSGERAAMRRMRAMNINHTDTNLTPEPLIDVDITPETPMLSREPGRGRTRLEKFVQRTTGQLPENLRSGYKQLERSATAFNESISSRSSEALQNIRATSSRMFGRQYAQEITPTTFDSARNAFDVDSEGFANITPTQEELTALREAQGTAPLSEEVLFGSGERPKLTFSENLAEVRRGATSREAGIGATGALAGAGAGIGIGILTNDLMNKLGIQQNMATSSAVGGLAGAGGDVAGRIVSMGTASALEKAGITTAAETLARASVGGFARGALEGGVIGVALTPVDMIFNQYLYNRIHSHAEANFISSLTIGTAAVGTSTAIMSAAGTTAGATDGISLVVGAVAVAGISLYGYITGDTEDKKEQAKINNIKSTTSARTELIKSLPQYKYNLDRAIDNFPNKTALGIDDESWSSFKSGLESTFGGGTPTVTAGKVATDSATGRTLKTAGLGALGAAAPFLGAGAVGIAGHAAAEERQKKVASADQEKINRLFEQQITHYTIKELCKKGSCSDELKSKDKGALNKQDYDWLNNKMSGTLTEQENLQIQLNLQSLKFTQTQIQQSQTQMLDSWNNNQELITNPDTLRYANLDPTWKDRFDTYAKLDAQRRVIRAYQDNQTTFDQLPKNIRDMANLDPEFQSTIQKYYSDMATTARDMNISIPQLVQIQGTPLEQQQRVYEGMQFDTIKQNQQVVSDAQRIATQEDAVRQSAEHFYDIDQAYILTDPTGITSWVPSDAQILQAYNAGMTLREYTDYMHELAKGENGDFSRLPIYTQEQIKQFTDADVAHFNDELNMTGHEGLYTWDEQNRNWILHNKNNTLSSRPYSSPFIPARILRAREEYADMVHGLNDENQKSVDAFNTKLMRDLSVYGRHYDDIVGDVNNERIRAGRTDLLFYDVGKIYNKNKIEFTPISDVYKPRVLSEQTGQTGELTPAQQREIDNAYKMFDSNTSQRPVKEQYNLSRQEYTDVKRNIESKNIVNPNTEQLQTAVQEVKASSSAP